MHEALIYSGMMAFDNSVGFHRIEYEILVDLGYTHVIFVHSEKEFLAGDFPYDAIVVWPSLFTHLVPNELNSWIEENRGGVVIDVEAYSLTYPLTIENMIDNWQGSLELVRSISLPLSGWSFARRFALDELSRVMFLEERVFNDAIETAGIDVSEYGFTFPLTGSNFRSRHLSSNLPIGLELFNRLDENVQLELTAEIPNLLAELRSAQRNHGWSERWRIWRAEQDALEGAET
jgi:hypothetical protein